MKVAGPGPGGGCDHPQELPVKVLPLGRAPYEHLATFFREGALCDAVLVTEDGARIAAHRVVLAASSEFFRAMFMGAGQVMQERLMPEVLLRGVSGDTVRTVLGALYDGEVRFSEHTLPELLLASDMLEIDPVRVACCDYLESVLSVSTCVFVLLLAERYSLHSLKSQALRIARVNFNCAVQAGPLDWLAAMSPGLLRQMLLSDDLAAPSELDVAQGIFRWAEASPDNARHLPAMLTCVRFAFIAPTSIKEQVLTHPLVAASHEATAVVRSVLTRISQGRSAPRSIGASAAWETSMRPGLDAAAGQSSTRGPGSVPTSSGAKSWWQAGSGTAHLNDKESHKLPDRPLASTLTQTLLFEADFDMAEGAVEGSVCSAVHTAGEGVHDLFQLISERPRANTPSRLVVAGGFEHGFRGLKSTEVLEITAIGGLLGEVPLRASAFVTCATKRRRASIAGACTEHCGENWTGEYTLGRGGAYYGDASEHTAAGWNSGPALQGGLPFAGSANALGTVVVVGGSSISSSVVRLDLDAWKWVPCAPLLVPRVQMAVTAVGPHVLVLGGRSGAGSDGELGSVELFDVTHGFAGSWTEVYRGTQARTRSDASHARVAAAATSVSGRQAWVIGGQTGRVVHASAVWFDPARGEWGEDAGRTMSTSRKYAGVCTLDGQILVAGGMDAQRRRLRSVELYDPREGRWRAAAPLMACRSSAGVAALANRAIVAGGSGGETEGEFFSSVEAYVPEMDRWLPCASLRGPRSGLTLTPV